MNSYAKLVMGMITFGLLISCNGIPDLPESDDFELHWEVETNFIEGRVLSEMTLVNHSDQALEQDWTLWFNLMRLVDTETVPQDLKMTHINGDFYSLEPSEDFEGLAPGDELRFSFEAFGHAIKYIDAPAGAYFEFAGDGIVPLDTVYVAPFEREEQLHRSQDDQVPVFTPDVVFEKNTGVELLSQEQFGRIVPQPVSLGEQPGTFNITGQTPIHYHPELESEARFLARTMETLLETRPELVEDETEAGENSIVLQLGDVEVDGVHKQQGDEAYRLAINENGITVTGSDPAGGFYGIQSLRALMPVQNWSVTSEAIPVDAVTIEDAPGFGYRGLHLDVSRNFQPVETVTKLMDVMAFYKLNRFHFHLTDDEGWRLESDAFPELTQIGGRRGHTLDEREHLMPSYGSGPDPDPEASKGSGWYTREEYMDMLRYAHERHIEVIPEIDIPGHARAAKVAMKNRYERLKEEGREEEAERYRVHDPDDESEYMSIQRWTDNVINICQESTYRFLEVIFDELIELHGEAGVPLTSIHIGADEVPAGVWVDSPRCQALIEETPELDSIDELQVWFFGRMKEKLAERDLVMSGWEEIALIGYYGEEKELNPDFAGRAIPYVWSNIWGAGTEGYSYELANAGYEILMNHASNFYFDLTYNKHPEEAGLNWAGFVDTPDPFAFIPFDLYKSGIEDAMGNQIPEDAYDDFEQLTEEGRENILGLQAQLWGETMIYPDRVEYMALPRIIPLAERAWNPDEPWMAIEDRGERMEALAEAWNEFANRLGQRELPRLDAFNGGYAYRLPPPGAVIEDDELKANVAYPGLEIRYTTDGTEPDAESPVYEEPVALTDDSEVKLRTFDTRGRGSRVVRVDL